jgi:hypothetical protein
MNKLKKYKINTVRTKLIAVIAMLKAFPENKLIEQYSEIVADINKQTNLTSKEKSETQKKNWVTKDEIMQIWEALEDVVKSFKKNISEKQYNVLLQFMVLSLFVLINPRRNADYAKMIVVKKMEKDLSTLKTSRLISLLKMPLSLVIQLAKSVLLLSILFLQRLLK